MNSNKEIIDLSIKIKELESSIKNIEQLKKQEHQIFQELKSMLNISQGITNRKIVLTEGHKKVSDFVYWEMMTKNAK